MIPEMDITADYEWFVQGMVIDLKRGTKYLSIKFGCTTEHIVVTEYLLLPSPLTQDARVVGLLSKLGVVNLTELNDEIQSAPLGNISRLSHLVKGLHIIAKIQKRYSDLNSESYRVKLVYETISKAVQQNLEVVSDIDKARIRKYIATEKDRRSALAKLANINWDLAVGYVHMVNKKEINLPE